MHAVGADGPELNRRLSARLGLGHFTVPSRSGLDYFAEYVLLLGLFSATCSKIAHDLYAMTADEIGEIHESLDAGVIGSSTMPHKVNSKIAVHVIALGARVRAQVPLALEAMQPSFEGDGAHNQIIAALIDQTCPLAYELIVGMDELIGCIGLRSERMRRNLDMSGDVLASENAMMALAPMIGRSRAHDLLHHAVIDAAQRGMPLAEAILADPSLPEGIPESLIRDSLDPARYTGLSTALARQMAAAARQAAGRP